MVNFSDQVGVVLQGDCNLVSVDRDPYRKSMSGWNGWLSIDRRDL